MNYPGSQGFNSLQIAYFLNSYKLYIEITILLLVIYPSIQLFRVSRYAGPAKTIAFGLVVYIFCNFLFTAENKFRQPKQLTFESSVTNVVRAQMMIQGIEVNGQSKAYPVSYIDYHHQVKDSIGGKKILITYCGLCRSGRIFEPYIKGEYTNFRLVGINQYNAMLEDDITKSWWSQATGICIAGKLKGMKLTEVQSNNMSLGKWIDLYPDSKIMQPDPNYTKRYKNKDYYATNEENLPADQDKGIWSAHTFIIGVSISDQSKAYKWNKFVEKRIITDTIGITRFTLVLGQDSRSFAAFENPGNSNIVMKNDTIFLDGIPFNMAGVNLLNSRKELKNIIAHREFWFSWQNSYPKTIKS